MIEATARFALGGAILGAVGALGLVRVMATQIDRRMFGSFDGVAFGMELPLVNGASAAAAWLPSRRAAGI
jgi:hypothetical protein